MTLRNRLMMRLALLTAVAVLTTGGLSATAAEQPAKPAASSSAQKTTATKAPTRVPKVVRSTVRRARLIPNRFLPLKGKASSRVMLRDKTTPSRVYLRGSSYLSLVRSMRASNITPAPVSRTWSTIGASCGTSMGALSACLAIRERRGNNGKLLEPRQLVITATRSATVDYSLLFIHSTQQWSLCNNSVGLVGAGTVRNNPDGDIHFIPPKVVEMPANGPLSKPVYEEDFGFTTLLATFCRQDGPGISYATTTLAIT